MISVSSHVRVFAYGRPADLRRGFDGLSLLVRSELRRDPIDGALYLFVNRRRTRAKVLHFDGTGLWVYAKRLERGQFAALWRDEKAAALELTTSELALYVEGSAVVGRIALSPRKITRDDLALSIAL